LLHVILGDPQRLEFLGKKQVVKSCRVGVEAVVVACFRGLFAVDLVDPVASIIAATCVASDVAVRVALASAIAAATISSAGTVR
jgi:hypothetical protein